MVAVKVQTSNSHSLRILTEGSFTGYLKLPGDSRSWESPEKVDNICQLFIQIYACVEYQAFHQVYERASQ